MQKTKIGQSFTRAAAAYDTLAVFQRQVTLRMSRLLPELLPAGFVARRVLDGGCGTGFGSRCLRQFWPASELTGCDLSEAMVDAMRKKGFSAILGDLEKMPFPDNRFDFVWSSLAVQWCCPNRVFPEMSRVLVPGGQVFFSTLAPGTLAEIGYVFSGLDDSHRVIAFSPVSTLEHALADAGFTGIRLTQEKKVMHYADFRSALESIRGIGAGQTDKKRRALMGKNAWKNAQERYESLREEKGLPLTYELILGFATAGKAQDTFPFR